MEVLDLSVHLLYLGCGGVTISNGQVTFTDGNTQYNAVASVTCNDGYALGGSGEITCLDSGIWDISEAACEIKGKIVKWWSMRILYILIDSSNCNSCIMTS